MKKAVMVAAMAATLGLFAEEGEAYSLINVSGGLSYIQINQDLDAFSFDVLKYENSGLNGHAGYFVYSGDLSGKAIENYVKANGVDIAKNQTTVNVGELKEGDKVGFYKWEKTSGLWGGTKTTYDTDYMLGTKVVSRSTDMWGHTTETVLDTGTFVDYISGNSYQTGKGGWMKIEISATPAEGGPTGAPLPGALAVLLVGGLGAGAMKKARKRS